MRVEFFVPGHVPSAANLREHYMARARRVKAQRKAAYYETRIALPADDGYPGPLLVTLTRVYAGHGKPLDGHDNLRHAIKPAADGIAEALSIDDGDERLTWAYAQQRGSAPGLRVTIESREER